MFFPEVSSVLLLDRSGNDMLCSILFLSLIFDVLTDHFYWCPSYRQKTETLTPERFFPKFFPDFRILFFQQPAAGTFISIDKFAEFCFRLCTKHYMNMVNIMIPFLQNNSIPWGNISKPRERKRIEHCISFPDLSNRRTEDTPWKNIWLLSFSVQLDA